MFEYLKSWMQLKTDRRAVTALEYGLIAAAVSVAIALGMTTFGPALTALFQRIASALA